MKKFVSLILAAALSISVLGCAEKKTAPPPTETKPTDKAAPAPDAAAATPAPTPDGATPAPEGDKK
jgi:hypothetical protein